MLICYGMEREALHHAPRPRVPAKAAKTGLPESRVFHLGVLPDLIAEIVQAVQMLLAVMELLQQLLPLSMEPLDLLGRCTGGIVGQKGLDERVRTAGVL